MLISICIFCIYLSFILDLLVWPIPSEASTEALLKEHKNLSFFKSIGLLVVFIINLVFYLTPLVLALLIFFEFNEIYKSSILMCLGLLVSLLGRAISLKSSLLLKENHNKTLITKSIFGKSRNPISLGMHFTILGLVIGFNQWYLWVGLIFYFSNMHFKIILEEKHLLEKYGIQYANYISKTPRYLIW